MPDKILCISTCICLSVLLSIEWAPSLAKEPWSWPLDANSYGPDKINQDFGQWEGIPNSKQHHTGYDILTDPDEPIVMAPAHGFVVKMSVLDVRGPGCFNSTPNCSDHGLGNTLIIKHDTPKYYYSQVSHLSKFSTTLLAIQTNCPEYKGYRENGSIWVDEYNCDPNIDGQKFEVHSGDELGNVGKSGYGDLNYWPAYHLHFEAKNIDSIYSKDPTDPKDGFAFGYSRAFPRELNYIDPLHRLTIPAIVNLDPFQVTIQPDGNGISLRLGPNSSYAFVLEGLSGQTFYAIKKEHPTGDCALGWYKISKTNVWPPEGDGLPDDSSYFKTTNTQLQPGLIAATWVCRGQDKNDPWVK